MIVQCLNRSNEYDNIEVKSVPDYVPSHGFSLRQTFRQKERQSLLYRSIWNI